MKSYTKCQKCLTTPHSVYITSNKLVAFSEQIQHIQQRERLAKRESNTGKQEESTHKKKIYTKHSTSKKVEKRERPQEGYFNEN